MHSSRETLASRIKGLRVAGVALDVYKEEHGLEAELLPVRWTTASMFFGNGIAEEDMPKGVEKEKSYFVARIEGEDYILAPGGPVNRQLEPYKK